MRESSLKYGAAEREVSWGQVPQDPVEGKEVERPDEQSQHHFLLFLLPPRCTFPFHCPTLCHSPPVHIEPCGIWYGGRDLQGARVVLHARVSKRCVYHQLEYSGWELKCGKIKIIISLPPWSASLLCTNISNKQQEKHICRENFQAWLMLFVSLAGQSMAVAGSLGAQSFRQGWRGCKQAMKV